MSDDRDPNAPNLDGLRQMRGMLRPTARAVAEKRIGGKGTIIQQTKPRKVCPICMKKFDFALAPDDVLLKSEPCENCQQKLNEGYTACISDDRYAFVKSSKLADMAGKIIQVEKKVMDAIERQDKASKGEVNGHERRNGE